MTIPSDSVPFPGATPRPWKVVAMGEYSVDSDADFLDCMGIGLNDGYPIAILCSRNFIKGPEVNAALILEAVNSYDALKAEVQRLREAGEAAKETLRKVVSNDIACGPTLGLDLSEEIYATDVKLTAALRVP